MTTNTNKTNVQSLSQLINEHPKLPVIPLICNTFADYCNLYTDYTTGCIGTSLYLNTVITILVAKKNLLSMKMLIL